MANRRGQAPASRGSVATPVWILFGANALAVLVTYARLPPAELYHTSEDGIDGGLGRMLVFLNYPTALAALGIALASWPVLSRRERAVAAVACALCALVPWTVDQDDLDAQPRNALPAVGVLLVFALSLRRPLRAPRRLAGDRLRIALAVVLAAIAIPWMFAEAGFYAPDPILADERSVRPAAGEETLAAVHLGSHHGTAGVLLALAALAVSRARPLSRAASATLALMLAYGIANAAQDFWLEQVVKRGWTEHGLPSMVLPRASAGWLGIVVAAVLVDALWFARERAQRRGRTSARKSSSHSDIGT